MAWLLTGLPQTAFSYITEAKTYLSVHLIEAGPEWILLTLNSEELYRHGVTTPGTYITCLPYGSTGADLLRAIAAADPEEFILREPQNESLTRGELPERELLPGDSIYIVDYRVQSSSRNLHSEITAEQNVHKVIGDMISEINKRMRSWHPLLYDKSGKAKDLEPLTQNLSDKLIPQQGSSHLQNLSTLISAVLMFGHLGSDISEMLSKQKPGGSADGQLKPLILPESTYKRITKIIQNSFLENSQFVMLSGLTEESPTPSSTPASDFLKMMFCKIDEEFDKRLPDYYKQILITLDSQSSRQDIACLLMARFPVCLAILNDPDFQNSSLDLFKEKRSYNMMSYNYDHQGCVSSIKETNYTVGISETEAQTILSDIQKNLTWLYETIYEYKQKHPIIYKEIHNPEHPIIYNWCLIILNLSGPVS